VTDVLRILFVVRPDASTRFGGDTKLARDTLEAVRTLGIECDYQETDQPNARGYDLVHIFNIGQPDVCRRQFDACEKAKVPIALSPVWLDLTEFYGRALAYERLLSKARTSGAVQAALVKYGRRSATSFLRGRQRRGLASRLSQQRELLERAAVLLPNSAIEARDCLVQVGVRNKPFVIVPIPANLEPARYWCEARSGLVAVGRIETRKNQTGLLYALRNEPFDIELVGATYHPELLPVLSRWCPRARLHGSLPREKMLQMLGKAEVHALVSWCETAGIASMEAAAAGAKIVVGDRGAEVEYFGEDAEYADPADPESIRAAVLRAFARPPRQQGDSLDRRIRSFTWREALRETQRAYYIAVGQREPLTEGTR
jgi:glycosyltransferase involved in cell wall biosynthesis